LDKGESYYQYTLDIKPTASVDLPGELELDVQDNEYFTQDTLVTNPNGGREKWYRVRIPITSGFDFAKNRKN
jgi:hypothetical protein